MTEETVQTGDQSKKLYNVTFPCARIAWPAFDCDYGHCEAAEWDIEPQITARVDIWKCTPCEAYPDGYYLSLNDPNMPYLADEPGDTSNEKHLLCKIIMTGVPKITDKCIQEEIDRNMGRSIHIEYWNPRLPQPNLAELLPAPRKVPDDFTVEEAILITDETPEFVDSDEQPTIQPNPELNEESK